MNILVLVFLYKKDIFDLFKEEVGVFLFLLWSGWTQTFIQHVDMFTPCLRLYVFLLIVWARECTGMFLCTCLCGRHALQRPVRAVGVRVAVPKRV